MRVGSDGSTSGPENTFGMVGRSAGVGAFGQRKRIEALKAEAVEQLKAATSTRADAKKVHAATLEKHAEITRRMAALSATEKEAVAAKEKQLAEHQQKKRWKMQPLRLNVSAHFDAAGREVIHTERRASKLLARPFFHLRKLVGGGCIGCKHVSVF